MRIGGRLEARWHLHVVADVDAHAGDDGDRDAREDLSHATTAAAIGRAGIRGVARGHATALHSWQRDGKRQNPWNPAQRGGKAVDSDSAA